MLRQPMKLGGPKKRQRQRLSAYDVIKAIRKRAGIGGTTMPIWKHALPAKTKNARTGSATNVDWNSASKDSRFWDLRRWKADLNEPVYMALAGMVTAIRR